MSQFKLFTLILLLLFTRKGMAQDEYTRLDVGLNTNCYSTQYLNKLVQFIEDRINTDFSSQVKAAEKDLDLSFSNVPQKVFAVSLRTREDANGTPLWRLVISPASPQVTFRLQSSGVVTVSDVFVSGANAEVAQFHREQNPGLASEFPVRFYSEVVNEQNILAFLETNVAYDRYSNPTGAVTANTCFYKIINPASDLSVSNKLTGKRIYSDSKAKLMATKPD